MKIGILITGNEILSGKTQDINGVFFARQLKKFGIVPQYTLACGDDPDELIRCLGFLAASCQTILMTGGLGPTSDDLTAQIVAQFFKIPLEFNDQAWQNCLKVFQKLGRKNIADSNKKQAYLPRGSLLLPNDMGTAAGFAVSDSKTTVYCMPGVPYEMQPMFLNSVLPKLMVLEKKPFVKVWQVFAMGESAMQSAIGPAEEKLKQLCPRAVVSYQAHSCHVTYSVTSTEDKAEIENEFVPQVEAAFGDFILYRQELPIEVFVQQQLEAKKLSLLMETGLHVSHDTILKRISKNKQHLLSTPIVTHFFVSEDQKQGHLSLFVDLEQSVFKCGSLEKKCGIFGWKLSRIEHGYALFQFQLSLNPSHTFQVKKNRMELYCLCSVAAILS